MKLNKQGTCRFILAALLVVAVLGFGQAGLPNAWRGVTALAVAGKHSLAQLNCAITLNSNSQSFAANGGAGSVIITLPNDCPWQAINNNPELLTFVGPSSGLGSSSLSFTIAANNAATPRSGAITINGATITVQQGAKFLDVPPNHLFYAEIGKLSAAGVTQGCGNSNFCPDSNVTREQLAILLARSLSATTPPTPTGQTFQDVPAALTGYPFIEYLVTRQIADGCSSSPPLFCPAAAATRAQAAIFIVRALLNAGLNPPLPAPQMATFADVLNAGATDYSYEFIEEFYRRGIITGCQDVPRLFQPEAAVTQSQLASFLVRAFKLPNIAPVVAITAPANGATFSQGATITFTATATDAEDGNLTAAIVWTAVDAGNPNATPIALGTGASVTTSSLATGAYLITARATDSGNLAGSAQVGISVCSVVASLVPDSGLRIPQKLVLDASASYDTCNRPLKFYWGCISGTSTFCPSFLAAANADNNTRSTAVLDLQSDDVFFITLSVCAGPSDCAPELIRDYRGAVVFRAPDDPRVTQAAAEINRANQGAVAGSANRNGGAARVPGTAARRRSHPPRRQR